MALIPPVAVSDVFTDQVSQPEARPNSLSNEAPANGTSGVETQTDNDEMENISDQSHVVVLQDRGCKTSENNGSKFHQSRIGNQESGLRDGKAVAQATQLNGDNRAVDPSTLDGSTTSPSPTDGSLGVGAGFAVGRCNSEDPAILNTVDAKATHEEEITGTAKALSPSLQVRTDAAVIPESLPPRDSPLHLQIQAYALRWGYWASMIENKERRAEVLKWVTDQMRCAWEMAIRERYYATTIDSLHAKYATESSKAANCNDTSKRGRKRAASPSKQPAGFAYDGKDLYAVTNGELERADVTMEMINRRVENQDLVEAELLFDDVLSNLDRDIAVKDWSVNQNVPVIHGRNLLMFCLYTVQESRANIDRLEHLHGQFKKDTQKRNTQKRIDIHRQRVDQHLALATELNLRQQDAAESEQGISEEPQFSVVESPLQQDQSDDSRHDKQSSDADQRQQGAFVDPKGTNPDILIDLAKEVLNAGNQLMLYNAFQSRHVKSEDLRGTTDRATNASLDFVHMKKLLGKIFQHITWIKFVGQRSQLQEDPKEKIKMGQEIQRSKMEIENARSALKSILDKLPASCEGETEKAGMSALQSYMKPFQPSHTSTSPLSSDSTVDGITPNRVQAALCPEVSTTTQQHKEKRSGEQMENIKHPRAVKRVRFADDRTTFGQSGPNIADSQVISDADGQDVLRGEPEVSSSAGDTSQSTDSFAQQRVEIEGSTKQVYIDEVWLPRINGLLTRAGQPPLQGVLDKWRGIKDVLTYLGYNSEARNKFLRLFKTGFIEWSKLRRGEAFNQAEFGDRPSQLQRQSWPDQTAILNLVGKQGIMAKLLLGFYSEQCAGQEEQFLNWVKTFTRYDPEKEMFYPLQDRSIQHWQNVVASAQSSSTHDGISDPGLANDAGYAPDSSYHSRPLKLNPPKPLRNSLIVKLRAGESHDFGEYSSHLPNISQKQGFAFRFTPYATMQQRERLDELITDYITKQCAGRTRPYGAYVQFADPEDPDGGEVAHGFWNLRGGGRPQGSKWFYSGQERPKGWETAVYDNEGHVGASSQLETPLKPTSSTRNKVATGNKRAKAANVKKRTSRRAASRADGDSDSDFDPNA